MSSSFPVTRFPAFPVSNGKVDVGCADGGTIVSSEQPSDEALVEAVRMGDSEALRILFRRYVGLVRSIGRRILRDDAEAEDLVQEVFLFFVGHAQVFDSKKGSARTWIVQNVYYQAISRRRYLSTRHRLFENRTATLLVGSDVSRCGCSADAMFDSALIQEILQILTSDQFETIRLFFFEGYTLSEISEKLRQPLGNVRHHYYRGLNKLRARLFPE
jgi:RNA polymerase sigma-70 factor, ECF subfamily